jgi:hypothetical protein
VGTLTDIFDTGRLGLSSREGRRLDLEVAVDDFDFAAQRYAVPGRSVSATPDADSLWGTMASRNARSALAALPPSRPLIPPQAPHSGAAPTSAVRRTVRRATQQRVLGGSDGA